MGNFARLLPIIMLHEGVDPVKNPTGYADIPGDPGGVTQWGISTRAFLQMRLRSPERYASFPHAVNTLTRAQAELIYRWEYWDAIPADLVPDGIALVIFDAAVNQGPGTAVQLLQRALSVKDDGAFGPKSQAALAAQLARERELLEDVLWQRLAEYQRDTARDIVDAKKEGRDSAFPRFLAQLWVPRLLKCRAEAGALA